jgi:hypothetical protein
MVQLFLVAIATTMQIVSHLMVGEYESPLLSIAQLFMCDKTNLEFLNISINGLFTLKTYLVVMSVFLGGK